MWQRLFPPACPCDPAAKAWVEDRLQWLAEEFDDHAFNGRRIVLPTRDFFPDRFDGSDESIRAMIDRVCDYMDVVPDLIDLEVFETKTRIGLVNVDGHGVPDAAGTYQETDGRFLVRIDAEGVSNTMALVGTIAHELAHVRLLGEGRYDHDAYDNELLTDLTVAFFGLGLFLANLPRAWMSQMTTWPGTKLKKPEYMNAPMHAYALAHLAWFRGEEKPAWAKHLHPNMRPELRQGIRYLFRTGDSEFRPKRCRRT